MSKDLKAPNGKPSNLTPEQWNLVRTSQFKSWFGDWENDPKNASKVVDDNGEPMVVYHRTNKKFNIFDKSKLGENTNWETALFGFYFSNKIENNLYGKKVIQCFLNIKEPYEILTSTLSNFDFEFRDFDPWIFEIGNNDGLIIKVRIVEFDQKSNLHFCAFEPNQIKLADGTNTTFDGSNPDIRFAEGGTMKNQLLAPNGKPSNLTPEQWRLVRTPKFKAWFGDWENDPENASKVVDENGEPLVVYHGTENEFTKFELNPLADSVKNNLYESGMWFFAPSFDKSMNAQERAYYYKKGNAEFMAENWLGKKDEKGNFVKNKVVKAFLNVRNPIIVNGLTDYQAESLVYYSKKMRQEKKNDAVIMHGSVTDGNVFRDDINILNSNQIKLADGTNTTFDESNLDIRFAKGGNMKRYEDGGNADDFDLSSIISDFGLEDIIDDLEKKANEPKKKRIVSKKTPKEEKIFGDFIFADDDPSRISFPLRDIAFKFIQEQNHKEVNTPEETKLLLLLTQWTNSISEYDKIAELKPLLIKLKEQYPLYFKPDYPNGTIMFRGLSRINQGVYEELKKLKVSDFVIYKEDPKAQYTYAKSQFVLLKKPIDYVPSKPIQSWTPSLKSAQGFYGEGMLITKQDNDFFINENTLEKIYGSEENENIHIGKKFDNNVYLCLRTDYFLQKVLPYILDSDVSNESFEEASKKLKFANGGNTNTRMKKIKRGGITYGKSHAEGGIPVKNQSTGDMLEVEGGEGIVNKRSMASNKKVKLNGKEMTICEAVSQLNQLEGGVQFSCDDVSDRQFIEAMAKGGELERGTRTEQEHIQVLRDLYAKRITPKQASKRIAKDHLKEDTHYYSKLAKMEGKMANGGAIEGKYSVTKKPDENDFYYIIYTETGEKVPNSKLPKDIGYGKIINKFDPKRRKYDPTLALRDAIDIVNIMNRKDSKMADGGEVGFENTKKLIKEIEKYSNYEEGEVLTNEDGDKYRYDNWKLKYRNAANFLVRLFEKASTENTGKYYNSQFFYGDQYSFAYTRPEFKGQPNGTIYMRKLVLLDDKMEDGGKMFDRETEDLLSDIHLKYGEGGAIDTTNIGDYADEFASRKNKFLKANDEYQLLVTQGLDVKENKNLPQDEKNQLLEELRKKAIEAKSNSEEQRENFIDMREVKSPFYAPQLADGGTVATKKVRQQINKGEGGKYKIKLKHSFFPGKGVDVFIDLDSQSMLGSLSFSIGTRNIYKANWKGIIDNVLTKHLEIKPSNYYLNLSKKAKSLEVSIRFVFQMTFDGYEAVAMDVLKALTNYSYYEKIIIDKDKAPSPYIVVNATPNPQTITSPTPSTKTQEQVTEEVIRWTILKQNELNDSAINGVAFWGMLHNILENKNNGTRNDFDQLVDLSKKANVLKQELIRLDKEGFPADSFIMKLLIEKFLLATSKVEEKIVLFAEENNVQGQLNKLEKFIPYIAGLDTFDKEYIINIK
jgi:hypothetical protein